MSSSSCDPPSSHQHEQRGSCDDNESEDEEVSRHAAADASLRSEERTSGGQQDPFGRHVEEGECGNREEEEEKAADQNRSYSNKQESGVTKKPEKPATTRVLAQEQELPDFKDQCRNVGPPNDNETPVVVVAGGNSDDDELLQIRAYASQPLPIAEAIQIFDTTAAVPKDFLCPLSGTVMLDPVVLFPSGITYDKEHLCQSLLREPDLDPSTNRRYLEKLRYCDNVLVQRMLVRELGSSAYRVYDDAAFQSRYDQAWAKRRINNLQESGGSPEFYRRIEALMFGMNRCRVDMENAFALTESTDEDAVVVAYRAWFLDPGADNIYANSCTKDKRVADKMWHKAADELGLTQLAESGDPFAEFLEGKRHEHNLKNKWKAYDWYQRAGRHGHAVSKWALAELYRKSGMSEERNIMKALKLYRESAGEGHCSAQVSVGIMHMHGPCSSIKKDYKIAAQYFRKAAEQGDDHGQFCLGWMYQTGSGLPKDIAASAFWYNRAADQGHVAAIERIGRKARIERVGL